MLINNFNIIKNTFNPSQTRGLGEVGYPKGGRSAGWYKPYKLEVANLTLFGGRGENTPKLHFFIKLMFEGSNKWLR